ncbi:MAG TPA: saccharopine dehydrogenase C-terminal domain-containing protein [Cytophagales bacterium]|nr:saccharopine dehydrogenase C-terminal domain-containing protein [Cytophagales bacterium]
MENILILGAGRSSIFLIDYLLQNAVKNDWRITVADINQEQAENKIKGNSRGKAVTLNADDEAALEKLISEASIVVSLLPPSLHIKAAKYCLKQSKNLLTASYVSPEMHSLHKEVKEKGLLFLNEMGMDPGIDHMSAIKVIDQLKSEGKKITTFKSFCGGLIAPESDTNPWGYKFTWNPKNIILAGQGTARFLEDGQVKYVPYHQLFKRVENFYFERLGEFRGYANRDSLKYREEYGLDHVKTLIRGTLRKTGFCKAWDVFVELGMTDDSYHITPPVDFTKKEFLKSFLPASTLPTRKNLAHYLNLALDDEILVKIGWLGFFEDEEIESSSATPADILLSILLDKWKLEEDDKDMVVMQHQFIYEEGEEEKTLITSFVEMGENPEKTAMAKTVGLPLAIATKLVLENKIPLKGVVIPTNKEIYEPVLYELEKFGIHFKEEIIS